MAALTKAAEQQRTYNQKVDQGMEGFGKLAREVEKLSQYDAALRVTGALAELAAGVANVRPDVAWQLTRLMETIGRLNASGVSDMGRYLEQYGPGTP